MKFTKHQKPVVKTPLRLDLGSGKGGKPVQREEGIWKVGTYIRVDIAKHKNVDKVHDLTEPWPWKTSSIDEVNADYLLHLFTVAERAHFANELHRVLKPEGKAVIITPHWATAKAYINPEHPPVSEAWYFMLGKAWREAQNYVDTTGLLCDFETPVFGYGLHTLVATRNHDYQQHAVSFWKEAAQDLVVTLMKK
jgi:SAM-dependent methyltransferase